MLFLLLACSSKLPEVDGSCGRNAAEVGVAGGSGLDTFDIDWTWSRRDSMSYGEVIAFELGDDIKSFAVTVDAGGSPSGAAWMTNAGLVITDSSGEKYYGDKARNGQVDSWDSWDSAWDSAWDSGDTGNDTGWYPDGDGWGLGPLWHSPAQAGTIRMPIDMNTDPSPGCVTLLPVAKEDLGGTSGQVHVVTKRSAPTSHVIDLNVINLEGSGISDDDIWNAVADMERIYAAGGTLELGDVTLWYDDLDTAYFPAGGKEIGQLRAGDYEGDLAMNMFFIADFLGDSGTLGIASGIPGAMGVQGTAGSGVTVSVETHLDSGGDIDIPLMGSTMAHELGHQFGLFHTTEADGGTHDVLDDTPECTSDPDGDGYATADECAGNGGENFMFWGAGNITQEDISSQQATLLNSSPPAK
ncbi:MAG: hypothetical protein GY913_24230 [Proteobacteria bacterium]|nr:hypothetical protein [Pseudomonadota bacterium]MCP4920023.1 hypothetical protein [Pseudomonadota bacterium]